jgi:hypothetical protein
MAESTFQVVFHILDITIFCRKVKSIIVSGRQYGVDYCSCVAANVLIAGITNAFEWNPQPEQEGVWSQVILLQPIVSYQSLYLNSDLNLSIIKEGISMKPGNPPPNLQFTKIAGRASKSSKFRFLQASTLIWIAAWASDCISSSPLALLLTFVAIRLEQAGISVCSGRSCRTYRVLVLVTTFARKGTTFADWNSGLWYLIIVRKWQATNKWIVDSTSPVCPWSVLLVHYNHY